MSLAKLKAAEKPKNTWKTLRRLLGYVSGSGAVLSAAVLAAVMGTAAAVAAPKILGSATTLIWQAEKSGMGMDSERFLSILALTGGLYAVQFVCAFLQTRFMTVMAQSTAAAFRSSLKAKMGRVPISFFDKHAGGNLMSIAVSDTDNVACGIQQSLVELITGGITIAGMLFMMILISWRMSLIAVLMIPVSALLMKCFLPKSQKHMRAFLTGQGELGAQIEESYHGHAVIASNGGEARACAAFEKRNAAMNESGWKAAFTGAFMMKTVLCFKNLIYVCIAAMGARFVWQGSLAIGDMQAFLIYAVLFSAPVTRLGMTFTDLVTAAASAERIFEVLDEGEMTRPGGPYAEGDTAAKVSFSHVRFGYGERMLMKDFSLDVAAGQMVAVVGHTGAGKTTLINLLEGFYDPQGGAIYVDGKDMRSMEKSELRGKIGMVLQDTWLFSGTIYDNIRYGSKTATHEQIMDAAKAAFVDDFVRVLPNGYNTVLGEEADNISQGQRQLITIARAFVSDPEILILDEATSNVDSRTEMLIQRAVKKLLAGRTSFVIAHRLSTIYDADTIIVMQDGVIAERGTHRQLVRRGGVYAELYNSQFAPARPSWQMAN